MPETTPETMPKTMRFEAEVEQLLDLMIHSLYKHRDIFLRELVSNASDALDKVRVEALRDPGLLAGGEELEIRIEPDREARTLAVVDNGIGMSREEVIENLGTIARSGTRRFLERLRTEGGETVPELIGQFGVGFYSSFMVADEVTVETRRAGEETGTRWRSRGAGEFTIEPADGLPRGTRVTLHLRDDEEASEGPDLFAEWTIRDVVRRYSDFVEHPIRMDVERRERPARAPEGAPENAAPEDAAEDASPEPPVVTETLNSMKPLWLRDKAEIERAEYDEFYKHLTRDWSAPLEVVHFKAEGTTEYTALLYVPSERPFDLFDAQRASARLSLYVKRVFIMSDCEELLPGWLRFVRGIVDAPDLPLNVSRETLQHNRVVQRIRARLEKKVLDALGELLGEDRERYRTFWTAFGPVLKEGIYHGADEDRRISKLCLFESTHGEEATTLDEYVARMPEGQPAIYALVGEDRRTLARSPHLEAFRKKGYEVLLCTDPIDEWMLQRLTEYAEKPVKQVEKGELDFEEAGEKAAREEKATELEGLLGALREALEGSVEDVRLSSRLTESPAVLVAGANDLSPQMQRVMRQMNRDLPESKRTLELNADHRVTAHLKAIYEREGTSPKLRRSAELLFGQALLAEGSPLPDPARFAELVGELLVAEE